MDHEAKRWMDFTCHIFSSHNFCYDAIPVPCREPGGEGVGTYPKGYQRDVLRETPIRDLQEHVELTKYIPASGFRECSIDFYLNL